MTTTTASTVQKVSVLTLTGVVVGSMVGGGVFTLPSQFGQATGVLGAVIAWIVAGLGMLMLAFVFQSLAVRRPDLDSGIYIYAQEGFGGYAGFNAAWGYWASNVAGNVFYLVLTMTTLSIYFPSLGQGNTVLAVVLSSALVWVFCLLIVRGVRQAVVINRIVTVCKLVPICLFVLIMLFAFDPSTFSANFWGEGPHTLSSVFDQVTDTMLVTAFAFLGVEGASVYSRLASRREDVGRATLLGFFSVLALFASVTLVSYGNMTQKQLADASQPSVGAVLQHAVGSWGDDFIRIAVVIAVQGAFLAWTLMNVEVLYMPARTRVMPRFLARTNRQATAITALLVTSLAVQLLLLVVLFVDNALTFMLKLDTALSLVPYLLAAAYAVKLTVTGETYGPGQESERRRQRVIGVLAVLFAGYLLYAAGLKYLLPAAIVYAPGVVLYLIAQREHGRRLFRPAEAVAFVVLTLGAVVGLWLIIAGELTL